jgi:prepilin-type N-terminal cleavage/methylation domain-containing protein
MITDSQGRCRRGFTLIELITVVAILAVLMSLLAAVAGRAIDSARRAQAANDISQIVTAVNAYREEYGRYPVRSDQEGSEATFRTDNSDLFYALRAIAKGANAGNALNPRCIVFLDVPDAKNSSAPRAGMANGIWYDPWGRQPGKPESGIYHIRIDAAERGYVTDPYPGSDMDDGGSAPTIRTGVIAWSLAKGGLQTYELRDQIISWR